MSEDKNPPIKSVTVVAFRDDEVLLIKSSDTSGHANGIYGLPAGRLEGGETYVQGAVREFNEESGLETRIEYLIKMPTFYEAELERKDGLKKFCAWSYYCTKYWGEIKASDEGEPLWIKIDEVKNLHLQINVDKMIAEAIECVKNK